ncbi:hypothetical protein F9K94_06220 [Brucella tritici]|uniref:Peptidase C39 domain-containing protein n=1 Tax=Brucella tritici TaxID=94626 RepID=A0A7V7VVV0_9HYPH|nr:hypothetical protein [Brucella tritici]KAB2657814.1 hypothetical protein F9K94_06220 [Brucella tritici]
MNIKQWLAIMADNQRSKLRPYLQGSLDSLCGVYALINGIRWALRNEPLSAKGEHWEGLFRKLTNHAIKNRGDLELVSHGVTLYTMIALTHIARDRMRERHKIELLFRRPFAQSKPLEAEETLGTIEACLCQPDTAVLAAIYGTLDHWCVVKQLDDQHAYLFDSDRLFRLPRSALRPQEFIEPHKRRAHVQPGSIIVMNISKS